MNGTKILATTICNVKFLDSLNFFGMPLRDVSKPLGLQTSKSWYPH